MSDAKEPPRDPPPPGPSALFGWFEGRLAPFPEEPPSEPPRSLVAFCHHFTRGAWRPIALMAVLSSAIAIVEVVLYASLGEVVDWLASVPRAELWERHGSTLTLLAALVLVALPALALLHSTVLHQTLLGNYPMRIRWQVHRYLLGQSLDFYERELSGRVATKLMQTALAVRESVLRILDVLNYVAVYFVGVAVVAAGSDLRLLVPFAAWLLGYLGLLAYHVPRLRDASERQADARSTMTGRIVDSYANIVTVKLFSHARREETYAREAMSGFLQTVHVQMRWITRLWVSLYLLNSALLVVVSGLALWLWSSAVVGAGAVAVVLGVVLRLKGMSQWIMWEATALFENVGTVRDGVASLARPRLVLDRADARPLEVKEGAISFDGVRFHYGKGRGVLDELSLELRPGEKVGLVGRSGAGKSTIVKLLLRFYDLEAGTIRIDGQDVAGVTQESLRAAIGVVTQEPSLLHRSIRDNIRYGRPGASDEDVVIAAKEAAAHDFIVGLEDPEGRRGYDAHVGERGVRLSGGQRQRLAIARVLLKNAPILVLDEATSALDSDVEAAIQSSLGVLMRDKTVIAIAHRLSTIASLDRLVVLDAGRVVESGSHDELLQRGGLYAKLWARQSGGFLGDAAA